MSEILYTVCVRVVHIYIRLSSPVHTHSLLLPSSLSPPTCVSRCIARHTVRLQMQTCLRQPMHVISWANANIREAHFKLWSGLYYGVMRSIDFSLAPKLAYFAGPESVGFSRMRVCTSWFRVRVSSDVSLIKLCEIYTDLACTCHVRRWTSQFLISARILITIQSNMYTR